MYICLKQVFKPSISWIKSILTNFKIDPKKMIDGIRDKSSSWQNLVIQRVLLLRIRCVFLWKIICEYRLKSVDKPMIQYKLRELVSLISPKISLLKTSNRQFKFICRGPLVVYTKKYEFQSLLTDIEGKY